MSFAYRELFEQQISNPNWWTSDYADTACAFTSLPKLGVLFNMILVDQGKRPAALFMCLSQANGDRDKDFLAFLKSWNLPNLSLLTKPENPSRSTLIAFNHH